MKVEQTAVGAGVLALALLLAAGAAQFSGDAGYERRWACIAFVEPNGTKVEQCGSVPGKRVQGVMD